MKDQFSQSHQSTAVHAADGGAGGSGCRTPGTIYSTSMPTATSIQVTLRFPFVVEPWATGRSMVTDGPKLQRYEQAAAERKRVDDLIHDQMEAVAADAYRVVGFTLAAAEWNAEIAGRPFSPADWHRLTFGEQIDYAQRAKALTPSTLDSEGLGSSVAGSGGTASPKSDNHNHSEGGHR